jgi:hypothetical protein
MTFQARCRRLKEFARWFELKYGATNKLSNQTAGAQQVLELTVKVRELISSSKPRCYWCTKKILVNDVNPVDDRITLHHMDEDRNNNAVRNLAICHRTCHQQMHKYAISASLSTAMLWGLTKKGNALAKFENPGVYPDVAIPSLGRG